MVFPCDEGCDIYVMDFSICSAEHCNFHIEVKEQPLQREHFKSIGDVSVGGTTGKFLEEIGNTLKSSTRCCFEKDRDINHDQ